MKRFFAFVDHNSKGFSVELTERNRKYSQTLNILPRLMFCEKLRAFSTNCHARQYMQSAAISQAPLRQACSYSHLLEHRTGHQWFTPVWTMGRVFEFWAAIPSRRGERGGSLGEPQTAGHRTLQACLSPHTEEPASGSFSLCSPRGRIERTRRRCRIGISGSAMQEKY